jgi:hypothetical protein
MTAKTNHLAGKNIPIEKRLTSTVVKDSKNTPSELFLLHLFTNAVTHSFLLHYFNPVLVYL